MSTDRVFVAEAAEVLVTLCEFEKARNILSSKGVANLLQRVKEHSESEVVRAKAQQALDHLV